MAWDAAMKKAHLPALLATALAWLALGTAPVSAQFGGFGVGGPVPEQPRIDVHFSGGPADNFVTEVRNSLGDEGLDIVITEPAKRVQVNQVKLTQVEPLTALQVMEWMTGRKLNVNVLKGQTGMPEVVVIRTSGDPDPEERVPRQAVYAIRDLLTGDPQNRHGRFTADEVLSVIEAAVDLGRDPEEGRPAIRLRLHPDTGLLLLYGLPREVQTVDMVIEQLRKSVAVGRDQAEAAEANETNGVTGEGPHRSDNSSNGAG